MIYLALLAVAIISLFYYVFSEYKSRMTASLITLLVTLSLSYFVFMLYVCKVSFHLSLFQRYFPIPRDLVMFLYALPINRQMVLSLLNLFCVVFLLSNVWMSQTFWPEWLLKHTRAVSITVGSILILQLILYDPYLYTLLYKALYPNMLSREAIKNFYAVFHVVTQSFNIILLFCCVSSVLYGYFTVPSLKIMRTTLGLFLLAYATLVITYLTFFKSLPWLLIDYAEKAKVVTYQLLFMDDYIPFYGLYPYILTVLVFMLIYTAYRLARLRRKVDTQSLSIAKNIEAANMPARTFCHFMKNEVLALSAELEEVVAEAGEGQASENMDQHLKWLFNRLDDIHRNIREDIMQMQQVPLDQVIIRSTGSVNSTCVTNGIDMQTHFPSEIPVGLVDPQYLQQALINLLQNACEAVLAANDDRKKTVSVSLYPQMRWILLDISDNGCGIQEADLTNIFSPFFTTKPLTKSWGIGLSLSYRIITSMGGRIEVESQVGRGTTFHILLPSVK